jgi:Tfp pilus assembly protein PilF
MRRRVGIAMFVVVAATVAAAGLFAQEWRGGKARAEGTVKGPNGQPIADATVSMRWTQSGKGGPDIKTDKMGKWAIMGLASGDWNVDISAPGYQTKQITITLSQGERIPPVETQLEPVPQAQTESHEEIRVGGKKISAEASDAIERGNAAFAEKRFAEARENYSKALAELPDNEPLIMRIAAAYDGEANRPEALRYARMAVEKNPEETFGWLLIATIELQNGNLDAGKAALAKIPPEKVTQPDVYMNMGIVLYNKKKPAEAEAAFDRALALKPDLADGYYYRGLARLQQSHKAEAKADFQKYLELTPDGSESKTVKELLTSIR